MCMFLNIPARKPWILQAVLFHLFASAFSVHSVPPPPHTHTKRSKKWRGLMVWAFSVHIPGGGVPLVLSYSNVYSFWKHLKDVYIETRCRLHRRGRGGISVAFTTSLRVLSGVFVSLRRPKNVSFVCFSLPWGLASLWREPLAMLRFG